ncbi:hypothetical protein [Ureaplasma diversum]|uniref:Uncharacterized protein n=1 Tax=Ureaplasma diversum NCTC 246 TaxID=1188241 RepID=A0A084EZ14_9BACT|nr:hypothetical protein [Ureaplasma diversum]KEZ23206.1 hypothetical protein UDIV_3940 [Ureaplasma diversum NCTC 246]
MKIKYIENDDLYVIGETKYTKEEFIAYIQADMLRSVLKKGNKYVEIQPLYNDNESIESHNEIIENQEIPFPRNLIFFGAPGTGKSYKLNQNAQLYFNNNYERVTFRS